MGCSSFLSRSVEQHFSLEINIALGAANQRYIILIPLKIKSLESIFKNQHTDVKFMWRIYHSAKILPAF